MGCAKGLPKDLSTNKEHFVGYATYICRAFR
jgi:hypothetical protein